MHSRSERVLYKFVARKIEASFLEAQRRLDLRQNALDVAHLGVPVPEGSDGGAERADDGTGPELGEPVPYIRSRKADVLLSLVADLNLVDADPRRVSARTPSARIRR